MHIAVLAASGATGHHLAIQALDRGHTVTGIARKPAAVSLPPSAHLRLAAADVHDPESIARAVQGVDVVVSGLGVVRGGPTGTLLAGARALIAAGVPRIIWLGAFGTGPSAQAAGGLTRGLLRLILGAELPDKTAADAAILAVGGTVFHAGPLGNGLLSESYRVLELDQVPHRLLPAGISRATVASAMIDEAEREPRAGILVPVGRVK